ncbi:hypothetical protein CCR85_07025 [Rhodothalassium salexigens]|uniref:hypothetical protein n=1 Tax=Rhodothalassium salexigens TaxID=1086 RepID=UPI00191169D5|nr:hypothetical protein [Rhodothalassium salexigens]MBK5911245.1 hypothetical protein [Rhodothalassium salexigens]MBK5920507.1 hypothetical protein [Rhodothalassium salexigens]
MTRRMMAGFALAAMVATTALAEDGAPDGTADAAPVRDPETTFRQICTACHAERMAPDDMHARRTMAAPPMNLMSTLIRRKLGNDRQAFVDHVTDFTLAPTADRALAMPRAIRRFGLMPPIQEIDPTLTEADIEAVANWLYDHYDYQAERGALRRHERDHHRP